MHFREIVGHEPEKRHLRSLLEAHRLPHALLFVGPEGIGKSLVARALAAALFCEEARQGACGRCAGCRQLQAGSHPDLFWVRHEAGKREIPIERVRELRDFVRLRRVRAPLRLAVVEDAHRLGWAAQNALLRTLEEPPPDSLVLLLAPSTAPLLPTVRSRCRTLSFRPLDRAELLEVLCGRLSIPQPEAERLAELAEGSPGRALALREASPELASERVDALRHSPARYGVLVRWVRDFSDSPEKAAVFLELCARRLLRDALHAADRADKEAARTLLRRADTVMDALASLRYRSPNLALLLESALLRLTRP
ncbi:MAG: hypothetical protein KatS3mg076_1156 [Candidatus Binatia bacterium]|nr:MAG: hypothetical protein KatS3mg076_1156 [Candidatus Binatia bacterium]